MASTYNVSNNFIEICIKIFQTRLTVATRIYEIKCGARIKFTLWLSRGYLCNSISIVYNIYFIYVRISLVDSQHNNKNTLSAIILVAE